MAAHFIYMQNHDVTRNHVCITMNETQSINYKRSGKLTTYVRVTNKYNTSPKLQGSPKE